MSVTHTIDWLSFTLPHEVPRFQDLPLAGYLATYSLAEGVTNWRSDKSRFGYSAAFSPRFCVGPVVYCWPRDGEQHTHVQWSGSALLSHGRALDLLREVVERGDRVTRLDLALDVRDGVVHAVYDAFQRGEVSTAARKSVLLRSDSGDTVYLGSRSSEKFVRVYDKAGQMGVQGPWVRIELELKGDAAMGIARHIVQEGDQAIPGTIRSVVDCPTLPWWRRAFEGVPSVWGAPKIARTPDRHAWLLKQVAPAIIAMHRENPHAARDAYQALCGRVGAATGLWPETFDGHTVERYTEVGDAGD